MKAGYFLSFASAVILLGSCGETQDQESTENIKETTEHHHDDGGHHPHSANEYMHQKSVDELIEKFESPERDEYQQPEKVLEYLGDLSGLKIMDIGAGSGYFSVKLAEKGAHVIAADVSEEFQNAIKKRIEENGLENIELRKIAYDSPDLDKEEVDKVFIVNTYHHIENRVDYFAKVKAGTKSTGELVLIDFFKKDTPVGPPANHKISKDQVVKELKEAGYSNFDVNVDLLPYQYIIRAK